MSKGILLARSAALATCAICGKPSPAESVALGRLCEPCWQEAAQQRGWLMEPVMLLQTLQGMLAIPQRVMLPALIRRFGGERGNDGSPARLLARLIDERERLIAFHEERVVGDRCCYCGEGRDDSVECGADDPEANLVHVEPAGGLPAIAHCADFKSCDGRLAEQIGALVTAASQGQRPT